MDRIEDNKIIAEFMGLELEETLKKEMVYAVKINRNNPLKIDDIATEFYRADELKYHTSWDWLMEVINKIMKTELCENFHINVLGDTLIEVMDYQFHHYCDGKIGDTLRATYLAAVGFIKWYNVKIENV